MLIRTCAGLITFATKPAVKQPITGVIEDLRNALSKLECSGDTAMWDALNLAAEYINTYSVKFPEAKKRIVCLSDGADTNSKAESWRLCQQFQVKYHIRPPDSTGEVMVIRNANTITKIEA